MTVQVKARRYTTQEKMDMARLVDSLNGSLDLAYKELTAKGIVISKATLQSFHRSFSPKALGMGMDKSVPLGRASKISEDQRKAAVKIYEGTGFVYLNAKPLIKESLNITPTAKTLRDWHIKYGKEVCDDRRIKDVVKEVNDKIEKQYEATASVIIDLSYQAKEAAIRRILQLIPQEEDMNKLANVYKIIQEANGDNQDKPATLIQQVNNLFASYEKSKKDRIAGDIQDATVIDQ